MRLTKKLATLAIPADVLAGLLRRFQPIDIGFRDLDIGFLGEQQSDVNVETFTGQLANGGHAFRRAWNFDHDVRTGDGLPQAARFFDASLRCPAPAVGETSRLT